MEGEEGQGVEGQKTTLSELEREKETDRESERSEDRHGDKVAESRREGGEEEPERYEGEIRRWKRERGIMQEGRKE